MIEIDAVGAIAILWEKRSMTPYSAASGQAPRSSRQLDRGGVGLRLDVRNMRLFQTFAITLSNGTFWLWKKEWKPITPRPTERSRIAEYLARFMLSGARSMKSCSTLSRKRINPR